MQYILTLILFLSPVFVYAQDCSLLAVQDITAQPFSSPSDAKQKMICLEQALQAQGDRRAIFSSIYRIMTSNIVTALDADTFENKAWMEQYTIHFANLYRQAFYDYETGNTAALPETWLTTFDAARGGRNLVLQDAVLGINAHINRDLPHAIAAAGLDGDRASKYRDHASVNEVLGVTFEQITSMLSEQYGPGIDDMVNASPQFNTLLQGVFAEVVTGFRDRSWLQARTIEDRGFLSDLIVKHRIEVSTQRLSQLVLSINHSHYLFPLMKQLEGSAPGSAFCQQYPCID